LPAERFADIEHLALLINAPDPASPWGIPSGTFRLRFSKSDNGFQLRYESAGEYDIMPRALALSINKVLEQWKTREEGPKLMKEDMFTLRRAVEEGTGKEE